MGWVGLKTPPPAALLSPRYIILLHMLPWFFPLSSSADPRLPRNI